MNNHDTDEFSDIQDMYFSGNYDEAFLRFLKCASDGNVKCMRSLGWSYYEGKGCECDLKESSEWFEKASDAGDAESFFGLASIYYTQENYDEAFKMFKVSSESGFVPSLRWLGIMYEYGLGVKKDLNVADEMYVSAAHRGNVRGARAHVRLLFQGHKGILGKIVATPLLIRLMVDAFIVALKDKNSQRLM